MVGGVLSGISSAACWASAPNIIAVQLENVNGFYDCLNMEMQAFKIQVNGATL